MHTLLWFFLSALMCSSPSNFILPFAEANKSQISFSIDLIHRDSPLSPFYNSSMTSLELYRNAALRSIARFMGTNQFTSSENKDQSPQTIIVPDFVDYLMKIYIGTPPVERLAEADTGSDLVWVQCSPCNDASSCFPQDTPLFDPKKSSTYTTISCTSKNCMLLPQNQHACGSSNVCEYLYQYGDKSYTIGELAIDSINFVNTGDVKFPNSIFGCGYYNRITFSSTMKATGLVGLGAGPLSLVSQLGDRIGHKFSYCLAPIDSNSNSKLKFGDEAIISGNGVVSTPLTKNPISPSYYNVNLKGISVGKNSIPSSESSNNIIIDSGTTFTYLDQSLYNDIVTSVKQIYSGIEAVQDPPQPFDFCGRFKGSSVEVPPEIMFHFNSGDVTLPAENMYTIVENNLVCLLLLPNTNLPAGLSIFGNLAQMNFQVEYDLQGKKVSFAPSNCANNN